MNFPPAKGPHVSGDPWRDYRIWSIGLYRGSSPLSLSPVTEAPVLSAAHITDVRADYVADPFMLRENDRWYLYFEILARHAESGDKRGLIGLASSENALQWNYHGVVLDEQFHLSYPCVFRVGDSIYMVPESVQAQAVRLYRAVSFPEHFEFVAELLPGQWADPTIFYEQGKWWMFACATPFQNRDLHLFSARRPEGPWRAHPMNPVVADNKGMARPGGRVRRIGGRLYRFAQDCLPRYGARLMAAEIELLDEENYRESACAENPVLAPNGYHFAAGMHHMDAHQLGEDDWIAVVDGDRYHIPDELLKQYAG